VTLLSAWALAGLVLIAPLVLAHLRRSRPPLREVPSLLIWQELQHLDTGGQRRLPIPRLPLLLLLQLLALVALVLALARPAGGAPAGAGSARVLVLDDSVWMTVPGRLAAGERELERVAASAPRGSRLAVVVAASAPYVLYRGGEQGLAAALARVHPTAAPTRLGEALTLAGALLKPGGRIALARAPEDQLPSMLSTPGELRDAVAGPALGQQGIFSPAARCGIGSAGGCEVLASVRNSAAATVTDEYTVEGIGAASGPRSVSVPAGGHAEIAFSAPPGANVSLRLLGADTLAAAARARVSVPDADGVPSPTRVTLVGEPADALPVARALAAVAGVRLRLRTPGDYRARDARESDLVVLDRSLPGGSLPSAPGVLLIDPPRVPGGHVGAAMRESVLSGGDPTSPLLEGVELSSLALDAGGARVLSLPAGLRWIAWSPEGPLLASGLDAGRRLAVLAFDPAKSDLPQLPAFPLLIANLLRALTSPEQGEASLASPTEQPSVIDARAAAGAVAGGPRANLAPWLLLAALLVVALEAGYGVRRRGRGMGDRAVAA
jgi:hypothetical protein